MPFYTAEQQATKGAAAQTSESNVLAMSCSTSSRPLHLYSRHRLQVDPPMVNTAELPALSEGRYTEILTDALRMARVLLYFPLI